MDPESLTDVMEREAAVHVPTKVVVVVLEIEAVVVSPPVRLTLVPDEALHLLTRAPPPLSLSRYVVTA